MIHRTAIRIRFVESSFFLLKASQAVGSVLLVAETFCSLEDDEGPPPPVKAAGQSERLASVLEPLAHHGVETIPLKHTYDDLIALAVCFVQQ